MSLSIYKRGQGYHTRLWSALSVFLIVAIGCYRLYQKLYSPENIWVCTVVPGALCAGLAFLIFWLVNKSSVADFMISAEGEVKKVSWSSRREITVSTFIVIVVVALMAVLLWITDLSFQTFFMWILNY